MQFYAALVIHHSMLDVINSYFGSTFQHLSVKTQTCYSLTDLGMSTLPHFAYLMQNVDFPVDKLSSIYVYSQMFMN